MADLDDPVVGILRYVCRTTVGQQGINEKLQDYPVTAHCLHDIAGKVEMTQFVTVSSSVSTPNAESERGIHLFSCRFHMYAILVGLVSYFDCHLCRLSEWSTVPS